MSCATRTNAPKRPDFPGVSHATQSGPSRKRRAVFGFERFRTNLLKLRATLMFNGHALKHLLPILGPSSFLRPDWPGPIIAMPALPFALTWAFVVKEIEQNMWYYIDGATRQKLEDAEVDWQRIAFRNLRDKAACGGNGEKCDSNDRPFVKVMIQDDAAGPSRLLVPHLFDLELGSDYIVAFPEQTCAVAFRAVLNQEQAHDVAGMIDGCFKHGTEPVSPQRFPAKSFWTLAERNGW